MTRMAEYGGAYQAQLDVTEGIMNVAGVIKEDDYFCEIAVRDSKGRVLFYNSGCGMASLPGCLETWEVSVCVMGGVPESTDVVRLRQHLAPRGVQVWSSVFIQTDAGERPVCWDFNSLTVEVDRYKVADSLGGAGILSRAALQIASAPIVLPVMGTSKPAEAAIHMSGEYAIRISGGREVKKVADSAQVIDGCLVLELGGKLAGAWAKGWWEWVCFEGGE